MKNAQQKRKADFMACCRAYYNVIDYFGVRSEGIAAVLPSREEISFLEVFHTLIQSGWIVTLTEFKQILEFIDVSEVTVDFRKFLDKFCDELGFSEESMTDLFD